jgi:hypothetical protein
MGISMGYSFPDPDANNKKGYYEDQEFYALDDALYNKGTMNPYHHQGLLNGFIEQRIRWGKPWGIKNPWIQYSIGIYIDAIRAYGQVEPIVVRTRRPLNRIVKSLQKMHPDTWGENTKNAHSEYVNRANVFKYHMEAYPEIKVHEFWFHVTDVPDEEVLDWLKWVQEEENGKKEEN